MQQAIQNTKSIELSNKLKDLLKNYSTHNQALIDQGFKDEKLNLRALRKCNGNIETATEMIKAKLEQKEKRLEKKVTRLTKEQKTEKALQEIKELGFEAQSQKLAELGFVNLSRNARLLKRFSGELDKIIEKLEKRVHLEKNKSLDKKERVAKKKEEILERAKERKEKRERIAKVSVVEYEAIPETINTIYLDGNNMLFCEGEIRRHVLHKRLTAEMILSDIAIAFGELLKRFNVVLVYDRTRFSLNKQIATETDKTFDYSVLSAAPKYNTSDDALVEWAQNQGENAKNCLFVTSDRELQARLSESGVTDIMKPGRWLKLVKVALGEEKYNSILVSKQNESSA